MESDIVISGMSGRFPEADNVPEFYEKLINKVDLITDDDRRFKSGVFGVPRRFGKIKDLSKFDNYFFGLHPKEAHELDSKARILLEVVYETIADAGYDPHELRGRKIGVFIGDCFPDALVTTLANRDIEKMHGREVLSVGKSLLANRISYTFDFKGPSIIFDTACSSSAIALHQAFQEIRFGGCDAAIVGGTNLISTPDISLMFLKAKMISVDGKSKSFDALGDGYARSEAISTIFLQKYSDARRSYASIVHMKTNVDGFKIDGQTFPSREMQKRLMSDVMKECNFDSRNISYIEAHMTGTPAGDVTEMSSIADVFCSNREEPLLTGSVKSNMGHSEASSAICQIVKLLASMERGMLPPNIHFNEPHPSIKAFTDGRVKVITEPTPWKGPYASFNSFGFGGANVHGILKSNLITTDPINKRDNLIPQLVLYCGKTRESVQHVFESATVKEASLDFFALLHKLAYTSPKIKPYRGYKLLGEEEDVHDIKLIRHGKKLWYVFTGMDARCPAVSDYFEQIEVFANSFKKSAEILKPFSINLLEMGTNKLKSDTHKECKMNDQSAIPAIVSTAAIQVALVDVLNELGLKPDGIIGHGLGELGCAYADGCLTSEQVILASYWIAKTIEECDLFHGATAVQPMPWREGHVCFPAPIFNNIDNSKMVSEAKDKEKSFQLRMTPDNIVDRYDAAENLQLLLNKVIPDPKLRSIRWISSSYPAHMRNDPEAKVASALYFVHNLLSPVLFEDVLHHIPKSAIVVGVGPHELRDAIPKEKIGPDTFYMSLMKEDENKLVNLLCSIGKLYIYGFDPAVEKLYSPVAFPVPRGTPMISPLIKWDHSETWSVCKWSSDNVYSVTFYLFTPGLLLSPALYLLGHSVDGRHLFPASGYIFIVWRTFSVLKLTDAERPVPVVFKNVKFLRATLLTETTETRLVVRISKQSGAFEVSEDEVVVCQGIVTSPTEKDKKFINGDLDIQKESLTLNTKDIYKEFKLRGYEYGPAFQGIIASNLSGTEGILKWDDNWVTFLDTMFQISLLSLNKRILLIPTGIERITIDPLEHVKLVEEALVKYEGFPVKYDAESREFFSGGVYAKNMNVGYQMKKSGKQFPLLEHYKFVPYQAMCLEKDETSVLEEYASVCFSLSRRISELSEKINDENGDSMDTLKPDEDLVQKYLKSDENNYVLLKCLSGAMDISNQHELIQNIKACVGSYLNDFENDILYQTLLNECSLRFAFEVILENVATKTFKVIEICEGSRSLSSIAHEYLPVPAAFNISYSILHCNTELLSKDHLPPNTDVRSWENKPALGFQNVDVFVFYYLKSSVEDMRIILENAATCLKNEGVLLLLVKTRLIPAEVILTSVAKIPIPVIEECTLEQLFKELNLNIICKMFDTFTSTLYLLRKSEALPYRDSIIHVTAGDYTQWVDDLREKFTQLEKMEHSTAPERIWLVCEDSCPNGIIGLVNCLRQEPGGSLIRCVFTGRETSKIPKFSLTNPFYEKQLHKNLVMNVLQNESWGSYRHFRCKEDPTTRKTELAYLDILRIGDLSSLSWIHAPKNTITLTDDDVSCHVYYASLNFRDVMVATGRVPLAAITGSVALLDCPIGIEFSGRTSDGKRVMGIVSHKAMATNVIANRRLLWNVPDEWSLEEAATVPIVYTTAYYAFFSRGRLQKGERVLIHCGSGGVGQAAINIALSMNCDIYTTVGSDEKKEFLKEKYPQLLEEHIYSSRDATFEQHILHATKGEGVDVVLNSLVGDKLFASVNCLAEDGRFLEIGKYDMVMNSKLDIAFFLKNISFHGICLDVFFENSNLNLSDLVKRGLTDGIIKPLNTTVFDHNEGEQAFRYMASGRHIGKVLLKIREEEPERKVIPSPIYVTAIVKTTFDPLKCYIIIGGLGAMGLELCQWLIERGAKNVVLNSRSGVTTEYQKLCLKRWEQDRINVVISKINTAELDESKSLLMVAAKEGPVGGIFNLALVLRDGFMNKQTVQNFIDVCECKVESTKNLDLLSRKLCPDLDWFVCFSSLSCGRGNPGQTNYGYANSAMERICEERSSEGLPGLAVQWGPVGDVGAFVERVGSDIVINGSVPQSISSCFSVLDKFLQQLHPVVSSLVPYQPDKDNDKMKKENFMLYLAKIFGIKDASSINPESTLTELGMDSLMGVELKQILEVNFNTILSIPELQKLKVKELKQITDGKNIEDIKNTAETPSIDIETYLGKYDASSGKDLIPTDVIVHMNSIVESLPLFLIHPIEGSVISLQQLAEAMSCPVYGIQSTIDSPCDSLENVACWYWKHLKSFIKFTDSTQSINLAGYSFGASVAIEMALEAEHDPKNYPEIKNLIILDGSHNLISTASRNIAASFNERKENVEDHIIALSIFSKMFSNDVLLDKEEFYSLNNFSERLHYTANRIASACPYFSSVDFQVLFDQFASKIRMSHEYDPKYKLKKDVYLIKASENLSTTKILTEAYDLDKICEGKIISYTVEGSHISFIQDDSAKEVSNLMTKIFDKNK